MATPATSTTSAAATATRTRHCLRPEPPAATVGRSGGDAVGEPPADASLRPVAEQPLHGDALGQDPAVPIDDDEQVRRVLDQ